jgi:hypothetical protein
MCFKYCLLCCEYLLVVGVLEMHPSTTIHNCNTDGHFDVLFKEPLAHELPH